MRTIGPTHRVWCNPAANECQEVENADSGLEELIKIAAGERAKHMYEKGDLTCGFMSCGQGIGLSRDIPTVE